MDNVRNAAFSGFLLISFLNGSAQGQTRAPIRYRPYELVNLGLLNGATSSRADGLNELGQVVGTCEFPIAWTSSAFCWTQGALVDLHKSPGGNYSIAHSINSAGDTVGEADDGDIRPKSVLFRSGSVLALGASGGGNHRAIFLTNTGTAIGDRAIGFDGPWRGAVWIPRVDKPDRFDETLLPVHPSGDPAARMGYVLGANQAAQAVGYVQSSTFGQYGAFWNNNLTHDLTLLTPLEGDWSSYAEGLNDKGVAVGTSYLGVFGSHAVKWVGPSFTATALPIPANSAGTRAYDINNAGQIVGVALDQAGSPHWILWNGNQIVNLSQIISKDYPGWKIDDLADINDAGYICGTASYLGQSRAILLAPHSQVSTQN